MIIDKTLAFLTPSELERIDSLNEHMKELGKAVVAIADGEIEAIEEKYGENPVERKPKNKEEAAEAWKIEALALDIYQTTDRLRKVYKEAVKRYVTAIGNAEAVFNDTKEILAAATKEDFIDYRTHKSSSFKRLQAKIREEKHELDISEYYLCCIYLFDTLEAQYKAIREYGTREQQEAFIDLIAARAYEFYPEGREEPVKFPLEEIQADGRKLERRAAPVETTEKKPHTAKKQKTPEPEELEAYRAELLTEKELDKAFMTIPTTPVTETVLKLLGVGKDVAMLKKRQPRICHTQEVEVRTKDNKRQVIVLSNVSSVTLELENVDLLLHSKKAKKWFVFLMGQIVNQAVAQDGTLKRNYVFFTPSDLVNLGLYSSTRAAIKAFDDISGLLTSLKAKGELRKGKKTIEQKDVIVLFTRAQFTKREGFYISINHEINWALICAYYTVVHKAYFKLSSRASDLLLYVFIRARQNTNALKDRGYFTISMRAVQDRLNLPNEKTTGHPERDIRQPIEEAITAIEDELKDSDFKITPIYDVGAPIADYLDKGYLKVELKGKYVETFNKLEETKRKQIAAANNRKEKIKDAAIARNLAEKMKADGEEPERKPRRKKKE